MYNQNMTSEPSKQSNENLESQENIKEQNFERTPKNLFKNKRLLFLIPISITILLTILLFTQLSIGNKNEIEENENISRDNRSENVVVLKNGWFSIKNDKVYKGKVDEQNILDYADAETFEYIPSETDFRGYFKDKNYLYNVFYSEEDPRIDNSDPSTFEFLNPSFAKDKNQAYFDTWTMGGNKINIIKDIDIPTFEGISANVAKDKNKVIYADWQSVNEITQADPETITRVDFEWSSYTKDKNNVYFGPYKLENADPNSFELIGNSEAATAYSKDNSNVFYCGETRQTKASYPCFTIEEADVETFQKIKNRDGHYYFTIAKDKNNIYSKGRPIKNSDPDTFGIIGDNKAKDSNNSYNIKCDMAGCNLEVIE